MKCQGSGADGSQDGLEQVYPSGSWVKPWRSFWGEGEAPVSSGNPMSWARALNKKRRSLPKLK